MVPKTKPFTLQSYGQETWLGKSFGEKSKKPATTLPGVPGAPGCATKAPWDKRTSQSILPESSSRKKILGSTAWLKFENNRNKTVIIY